MKLYLGGQMKKEFGFMATLILVGAVAMRLMAVDGKGTGSEYDPIRRVTDKFMATILTGQVKEGFDNFLKANWYKPGEAVEIAERLRGQYEAGQKSIELTYGKPVPGASEFIGTRRLGKSLVKLVYLEKHEHAPFPWCFVFYRAQDEWKLNGVRLGDAAQEDMLQLWVSEPVK
jgi:hypothetical protein